jgi:hypothetical protein
MFSQANKAIIETCFTEKGWANCARIVREFPGKGWNKRSVERLIQKVRQCIFVEALDQFQGRNLEVQYM